MENDIAVDNQLSIDNIEAASYVGCLYNQHWYIGLAQDLSAENNDVSVKFMHPKGPSKAFFWPKRDDTC